jgi:hypothetical protein
LRRDIESRNGKFLEHVIDLIAMTQQRIVEVGAQLRVFSPCTQRDVE